MAWVLPAAGWCWKAGSPSAGIQVKAPPLGSFSSSGRKEVKITEKVTVLHKSESLLFYGFLSKGKKKRIKKKKNPRFSSVITSVMIRLDLSITMWKESP